MACFARGESVKQSPAAFFRAAARNELHDAEVEAQHSACVAQEVGLAEARIDNVDDDPGVVHGFAEGELAGREVQY